LFINIYRFLIWVASIKNPKAKAWIRGRRNWHTRLKNGLSNNQKPVIWIHCSSLGEFEQGRPIIERLRDQQKNVFILLTFFSPSGFEIRKNYNKADYVCYLPLDTPCNARRFIETVNPVVAIFVKYEFWYNYLNILKKRSIPVWLISGIFRKSQPFFNPFYGRWFAKQLKCFDYFFIQDQLSGELLDSIEIQNYSVCGDTRFDRVIQIAEQIVPIEVVERFTNGFLTVVAGSTWPKEEEYIARWYQQTTKKVKIIIAPHEIHSGHIQQIEQKFSGKSIRYSSAVLQRDLEKYDVLIIDNIGMLSTVYSYGMISIVGGGFGKGIHNVLEPTVYGIPVIFGPNYNKFREAHQLIEIGAGFPVSTFDQFSTVLETLMNNDTLRDEIRFKLNQYFASMKGSVELIMHRIELLGLNNR